MFDSFWSSSAFFQKSWAVASKSSTIRAAVLATVLAALALVAIDPAHALNGQELKRTEAMLEALGRRTDLVFIRNGSDFKAERAVAHLRRKLAGGGDEVATAEEFVDGLASSSSISGRPYMVRLEDGREITANEFFHSLLLELAP
jgi:hypothetical protein